MIMLICREEAYILRSIKQNAKALVEASKETELEVNADKYIR
jgi:hypothetical protein